MAIEGVIGAGNLRMDYMQLLMTQLRNQNPLEPMDNSQMTQQLTSLSQLEQLESMNSNFGQVLQNTQNNYAQSLIGKTVSFYDFKLEKFVDGKVDKVVIDGENGIQLVAGNYLIALDEVAAVSGDSQSIDSPESNETENQNQQ